MRLLMLVVRMDEDDWATAFIPRWVEALAQHVERVDVLALEVGHVATLPANVRVHSMGKTSTSTPAPRDQLARWRVLYGFYRQTWRLLPRCDAVFVHMIPRYAWLIAPFAVLYGKPITLWYTHRQISADLKRALPFVRRVVTAVPNSFPLPSTKVRPLGHGVNPSFFTPTPSRLRERLIVHVARLQPIKQQALLLEALAHLPDYTAVFIGGIPEGEDPTYLETLRHHAERLGVAQRVIFTGGLSAEAVRDWYQRASIAINLSPVGLFDKAALESMLCQTPTLVTNPAFADVLGDYAPMLITGYSVPQLTATIQLISNLNDTERTQLGEHLRQQVIAQHSLSALIPRLVSVLNTGEIT